MLKMSIYANTKRTLTQVKEKPFHLVNKIQDHFTESDSPKSSPLTRTQHPNFQSPFQETMKWQISSKIIKEPT